MRPVYKLIILFLIFNYADSEDCKPDSQDNFERQLQKKLLCNYNKNLRPVKVHTTAVNVTMKMSLRTIQSSYDRASIDTFEVGSWLLIMWRDEYLSWDPAQYGGLIETLIHSSNIWIPEISVWNSDRTDIMGINKPCTIAKTGVVKCVEQMKHTAICSKDYQRWPFDRQNCSLIYGTWMYEGEQVNLFLSPTSTDDFKPSKYWKILFINATRNPGTYDCCPNMTFPSLKYTFVLKRNAATTVVEYGTPIFVLMVMTLGSLCLSIQSPERIILMIVNTYLHINYIHSISYVAPAVGEDVPDAVLYFRDALILSSIILMHGLLMKYIIKKKTTVPQWVLTVTSIVDTQPGKLMFHEFDPSETPTAGIDDVENVSRGVQNNSENEDWKRFALFLNRVFFIFVILFYFSITIRYFT